MDRYQGLKSILLERIPERRSKIHPFDTVGGKEVERMCGKYNVLVVPVSPMGEQ